MKNLKLLVGCIVALLLLFSCEKQAELQPLPESESEINAIQLRAPRVNPCAKQGYIVYPNVPEESCTGYYMNWFEGVCISCK